LQVERAVAPLLVALISMMAILQSPAACWRR